jgi:hypothetical protein
MRRTPLAVGLLLLLSLVGWAVFRKNHVTEGAALRPPPGLAPEQRGTVELEQATGLGIDADPQASMQRESLGPPIVQRDSEGTAAESSVLAERGLRLRLVNPSGQALAGRTFNLAAIVGPPNNAVREEHGQAASDKEGRALFSLPSDLDCDLRLLEISEVGREARGWLEGLDVPIAGIFDGGDVVVAEPRELHPEPILAGWVVDQSDQPIAKAVGSLSEIHMSISGEAVASTPRKPWTCQVVVSPDGSFQAYGPPPNFGQASFFMAAEGFEEHLDFGLSLPRFDYRVVLSRVIHLRGVLLVPADGPPVTEYGVWLSDGGGGTGISPDEEGRFSAIGSTRSLDISVTHPGLGIKVYIETFALSPQSDGDIGTIDLRSSLWVVDLRLLNRAGAPLADKELTLTLPDELGHSDWYRTDAAGRLRTVLPRSAGHVDLSTAGVKVATLSLAALPSEVRLP